MVLLITVVVASSSTTTSSYPSNEYCNFTMTTNSTVTWLGKTRQQTYRQVGNKNDNNCTVCIKLGCVWCSSSSSSSQSTGYCYNGETACTNDSDVMIDSETACNNDVSLVVFLITIFLGIVLPILLICSCFSCVVYFARRYIKSRQYEQRIVPVEAEAWSDHHIMTFVIHDPDNNNNNNSSSNNSNNTMQTVVAYEYPDNDDRVGTVATATATATAVAIPMNR